MYERWPWGLNSLAFLVLEKTAQTNTQASVDITAENDKNIAKINLKD